MTDKKEVIEQLIRERLKNLALQLELRELATEKQVFVGTASAGDTLIKWKITVTKDVP